MNTNHPFSVPSISSIEPFTNKDWFVFNSKPSNADLLTVHNAEQMLMTLLPIPEEINKFDLISLGYWMEGWIEGREMSRSERWSIWFVDEINSSIYSARISKVIIFLT